MGQYADAFESNDIEWEFIPKLDHDLLKDIGVASVGHRMKLLESGAALGKQPLSTVVQQPFAPTGAGNEAEHRQLTVMFCDLVGSTALSQRLDPEDLREIIGECQSAWTSAIERYDGYIARYMGDGVLAYFGYPKAHEDDAERAVRAALGVVDATSPLNEKYPDIELAVRVGAATGSVVVGDLIGEGASRENPVVGETPNLAARLQATADENALVIAPMTKELTADLFEFEDLGLQGLRGINEPVRVWRVIREQAAQSRFEARGASAVTGYVGREAELGMLAHRWKQAKEGEGQLVLLCGEPGIGKSRAVMRLTESLPKESFTRLSYQCSPFHTNSPLHPVVAHLTNAARFEPMDTLEQKLDRLEQLLGGPDPSATMPLFADLLSIPFADRYDKLSLAPPQQKQKTLEALVDSLVNLCQTKPVLMLFEDLHWVDPTTQELLDLSIAAIKHLPVLLVATFRPEYQAPWIGQPNTTVLQLSRLSHREGVAVVGNVPGAQALSDEAIATIVDKTDGIPLFLEELARSVIDGGPQDAASVPASIHASLLARLDQLGDSKELAQVGAVVGREFSYQLLLALGNQDEPTLGEHLDRLEASGLVLARGVRPESTYRFKHALVQDAAYDSLLRPKRRALHHDVAQALENLFPDSATTQPEMLAHHHSAAGETEQALEHWLQAGRRATEGSANPEAVAYLRRGLDELAELPAATSRDEHELALQLALCTPLSAVTGFVSDETNDTYNRVEELCDLLETPERLYPVLLGRWIAQAVNSDCNAALESARRICALGEQQNDEVAKLLGYRMLGWSELLLGRIDDSHRHLSMALDLYDAEKHAALRFRYGHDSRVAALSPLAINLLVAGFPVQAMGVTEETIAYARRVNHVNTLGYGLVVGGALPAMMAEDVQFIGPIVDEILVASEEGWLTQLFVPWVPVFAGWHLARTGEYERGVSLMQSGIEQNAVLGQIFFAPVHLGALAAIYLDAGDIDLAVATLDRAMTQVDQTDERVWEAEIHRLRGIAWLVCTPRDEERAVTCFRLGVEVARSQGAKLLELRSATNLAELWHKTGRKDAAWSLLQPLYESFSEGFDTEDLKIAKALLDRMR